MQLLTRRSDFGHQARVMAELSQASLSSTAPRGCTLSSLPQEGAAYDRIRLSSALLGRRLWPTIRAGW
jgi:hypothetical protein